MLRLLALLLLLANGGYYAWSHGLLREYGLGPVQQAEPQRLAQQMRPEALRLLSAEDALRAEAPASAAARPAECLAAGLYTEPQAAALRQALGTAALPVGSWSLEPASEPARWIVYMGRYANLEQLNRKKAELRQRNVVFEAPGSAALEPGLSLGSFDSQTAANQRLELLSQRGVRTARVLQERAEVRGLQLRLPLVDEALRLRLDVLKTALAGKTLRPCK
ncbi:MAG: SPOR domain-containing protein [Burkholderiaceae bacterium]|nr:SPOR domain-containing protein [Burkholderiaceae bacterium]